MSFVDVNINKMKFVISVICFLASWATLAEGLYQCPGPLFTNLIDPAQAQAQGCVRAMHGRLSQVQAGEESRSAARTPRAADRKTVAFASRPVTVAHNPVSAKPSPLPGSQQRERDQHARAILESELARTRNQLQALAAQAGDADKQTQMTRLRNDEAALQRELARHPG